MCRRDAGGGKRRRFHPHTKRRRLLGYAAILSPLGVGVYLGCRIDCAMRRELSSMNLRMMLIFGALGLGVAFCGGGAMAQSAKDLVGAWTAISNTAEQGGVKSEPYGPSPQGMLIFEANGRYGLVLSRKDVPKFSSNSRMN